MKELRDLISAYRTCLSQGSICALATILHVEGSSYRRPGARMLIEPAGKIQGSVSGGCLERDLIRRAMALMAQPGSEMIRYDTTEDGDGLEQFASVGLGCNGVVDIWLETLVPSQEHPALALIEAVYSRQIPRGSVATVVDPVTSRSAVFKNDPIAGDAAVGDAELVGWSRTVVAPLLPARHAQTRRLALNSVSLQAGGQAFVLVESVTPPTRLVVIGAGHDTVPVVEFAAILGWETTVVDCRSAYAPERRRFAHAHQLISTTSELAAAQARIQAGDLVLLMTHNYFHDLAALAAVIRSPARYVGLLGARKRGRQLLDELAEKGEKFSPAELARLHSPVGLHLGAETPQEIALSVIAEMQAVLTGAPATALRENDGPIHLRTGDYRGAVA